ncbi:MAG: STAS domain-containing protein [Ancalomicrobiaceae bacterium]|nr:STAS domain-containing protein [Ancalomicrobiaceae bacterium]
MEHSTTSHDPAPSPSSLTIRDIQALHGLISKALTGNDPVRVAFKNDVAVDLSFVQLIESARLTAKRNGKTFTLLRPVGDNVRGVLERGGFLTAANRDAARFWLHEEVNP